MCGGFAAPLKNARLLSDRADNGFDALVAASQSCPMPVIEALPLIEDIRVSRVKGKTLFEMAEQSRP